MCVDSISFYSMNYEIYLYEANKSCKVGYM